MKHFTSSEVSHRRLTKWLIEANNNSITKNPTWTETRQVIDFGGHTFLLNKGQVFQCAHCGFYDPEWVITEVLEYFATLGIKPYDITVTVSIT